MTSILSMLVGFISGAFEWMSDLTIIGSVSLLDVIICSFCMGLVIAAFVNVVRVPGPETKVKVKGHKERYSKSVKRSG